MAFSAPIPFPRVFTTLAGSRFRFDHLSDRRRPVPAVAAVIVANYIAEQPWWMQIILGWITSPRSRDDRRHRSRAYYAVVTANVFIIIDDLHDIADVLGLFKLNNIYSTISYSSFNNHLSGYRYSIISFWNGVGSNGLIDFSQGAHTVYVKRYYQTNEFVDYNNGNSCLSPQSQFYKIITSNQSDVNKLFISGLVIKGWGEWQWKTDAILSTHIYFFILRGIGFNIAHTPVVQITGWYFRCNITLIRQSRSTAKPRRYGDSLGRLKTACKRPGEDQGVIL